MGPSAYRSNPDAALSLYISQAAETPLLTREEERKLANKIKKGNDSAREHMIKANLRLVIAIAKTFDNLGLPLLDIINEGNLGLIKAVEMYDVDHPNQAKFSTYASWWIKQSMMRALSNGSKTIRVPVHIHDKALKIRKARTALYSILGYDPSVVEIAQELNMTPKYVQKVIDAYHPISSLSSPVGEFGDHSLEDMIKDENVVLPDESKIFQDLKSDITEVLDVLTNREKEIIIHRFGLNGCDQMTLEEIGDVFGVTRERIRQIQDATLGKIRKIWECRDRKMERNAVKYRETRSLSA